MKHKPLSPEGLLFRQTRVKQHAKNITACNKNTIRTMKKLREKIKNMRYITAFIFLHKNMSFQNN